MTLSLQSTQCEMLMHLWKGFCLQVIVTACCPCGHLEGRCALQNPTPLLSLHCNTQSLKKAWNDLWIIFYCDNAVELKYTNENYKRGTFLSMSLVTVPWKEGTLKWTYCVNLMTDFTENTVNITATFGREDIFHLSIRVLSSFY